MEIFGKYFRKFYSHFFPAVPFSGAKNAAEYF
jgi:hypothetical protein